MRRFLPILLAALAGMVAVHWLGLPGFVCYVLGLLVGTATTTRVARETIRTFFRTLP